MAIKTHKELAKYGSMEVERYKAIKILEYIEEYILGYSEARKGTKLKGESWFLAEDNITEIIKAQ